MKRMRAAAAALLLCSLGFATRAEAQNPGGAACPYIAYGAVLTAAQWNYCFQIKQDFLGYTPVNKAGDLMLGPLVTIGSTSLAAGFNIQPGTAPSSPNNGDMWTTSLGLFVRINGVTIGPLSGGSASSFAGTSPITVSFPAGVVTYAFNFGVANTFTANQTIQSASANAFVVGANGAGGSAALNVDASAATQVAGLNVKGASTGGTVALSVIDSGSSNANISIDAKGSGSISLGANSTGLIQLERTIGLGIQGSVAGSIIIGNATSGSITVNPPTGALGVVTLTWPDATDTLVARATTDTLSNKTLASPTISGTVAGNFTFSGNVTHNGQIIQTATGSPGSTNGQTVIMGTISVPTLANNGQAWLYNTNVNGGILQGQGSNFDVSLANNSGLVAFGIGTGTQNITIFGTLTAASLSTAGTIGGSLCATSAGLVLYKSAINCFTTAASSVAPGTTTVSPTVNGNILYDNAGVLGQAAIVGTFITAGSGISISGTTTGTISQSLTNATLQGTPGAATGNASATVKMMGYGSTCKITPVYSTRVLVIFGGSGTNGTASQQFQTQAYFGTGAAPANGAAATGTSFGPNSDGFIPTATGQVPFSNGGIVTGLTVSTAYWFDQGLASAGGSGTASLNGVSCTVMEF